MNWNQHTSVLALVLLAYTWIGYPALLLFLQRLFARPVARLPIHPDISLILAVHNEQGGIDEKLRDCLNLKYPPGRIEILVVSDNSTDSTDEIVERLESQFPSIRLIRTGT